jgi:hypothetical protein
MVLAKALHLSLDTLVFDETERGLTENLAVQFETVSHMRTKNAASSRHCSTG